VDPAAVERRGSLNRRPDAGIAGENWKTEFGGWVAKSSVAVPNNIT
jgi:hypothetical protein